MKKQSNSLVIFCQTMKDRAFLTFVVLLLLAVTSASAASGLQRVKRQAEYDDLGSGLEPEAGSGEPEGEAEPAGGGVSLGKILGIAFLACCIIYCIGISWKVYKVCKGTYVEEEPVFLKYK